MALREDRRHIVSVLSDNSETAPLHASQTDVPESSQRSGGRVKRPLTSELRNYLRQKTADGRRNSRGNNATANAPGPNAPEQWPDQLGDLPCPSPESDDDISADDVPGTYKHMT